MGAASGNPILCPEQTVIIGRLPVAAQPESNEIAAPSPIAADHGDKPPSLSIW